MNLRENIMDGNHMSHCKFTYVFLCHPVHNIQPCFCASSLALAFSILAILAADLEPRTPPPQCRLISSKRSLKLVLIASTTFVKAARSPESTCTHRHLRHIQQHGKTSYLYSNSRIELMKPHSKFQKWPKNLQKSVKNTPTFNSPNILKYLQLT